MKMLIDFLGISCGSVTVLTPILILAYPRGGIDFLTAHACVPWHVGGSVLMHLVSSPMVTFTCVVSRLEVVSKITGRLVNNGSVDGHGMKITKLICWACCVGEGGRKDEQTEKEWKGMAFSCESRYCILFFECIMLALASLKR